MTATLTAPMDASFDASFAGYEVRLGVQRPSHAVYVRRRLMAVLVLAALCAVLGMSARSVLADRGGVPASTSAIGSAASPAIGATASAPVAATASATVAAGATNTYIVQPGDTLWTIAERTRGTRSLADYVDALVSANGGAGVSVGQLLSLP